PAPRISPSVLPNPSSTSSTRKSAYLFYNTVFPIRSALWDIRYLFSNVQEEQLLEKVRELVPQDGEWGVRVEEVLPRAKDGGAFVRFSFEPKKASERAEEAEEEIVKTIEKEAIAALAARNFKPWFNILGRPSQAFLVKGRPWMEDMNRFPSRELVVEYEGPEIPQEALYEIFRPYGKIHDIAPSPKSARITFTSIRSATSARNCLHSALIPPCPPTSTAPTVLRILYQPRNHTSGFKDFITSHPRITLPLLVALLGGVSYAIFDPVREFFVRAKVERTFEAERWGAVRWLKRETIGRLGSTLEGFGFGKERGAEGQVSGIEREREQAREQVEGWLKDVPGEWSSVNMLVMSKMLMFVKTDTFIIITGPRGSGKTALVDEVLADGKNILTIDCGAICKNARSDTKLVSELASAVGYWPQFVLASSLNNLIDLASVGLIGQKAGFSSSLDTQLKAILEVTSTALTSLTSRIQSRTLAASTSVSKRREEAETRAHIVEQLRGEGVRDGRIDAVAGNGAMSELGGGVERGGAHEGEKEEGDGNAQIIGPKSSALVKDAARSVNKVGVAGNGEQGGAKVKEAVMEAERLPVVVIKGFADKGEAKQEVLWQVIADWAAVLVENQVAHVIFTSDSVTIAKPLAKALPSKPFNTITLSDASLSSSLQYLSSKLSAFPTPQTLPPSSYPAVARLGGRQTDLELLVQKIRAGQTVEEAVEDIVGRSAGEIRKNFFGDDEEEAKGLRWGREQAWALLKGLTEREEPTAALAEVFLEPDAATDKSSHVVLQLKYTETLLKTFGGDEAALRALENAEMISIHHRDGRASVIRPGKPVYRSAFALLLSDTVFRSTLEYRAVLSALAAAQADLSAAQAGLIELSKLFTPDQGRWTFGGGSRTPKEVEVRVGKLLGKMKASEEAIEKLGAEKERLLKVLAEAD
ncbi:SPOSA6832_02487, partial [Sporobolomyces salmonicolor]